MKVLLYDTDMADAELRKEQGQLVLVVAGTAHGPWDCNFMKLVEATDEERHQLERAGFHLMPA